MKFKILLSLHTLENQDLDSKIEKQNTLELLLDLTEFAIDQQVSNTKLV